MKPEEIIELFNRDRPMEKNLPDDRTLAGFNLLLPYMKGRVIQGADHDVVYGPSIYDLESVPEAVLETLATWNFFLQDNECLASYV
jgi:hypothetical protein